MTPSMTLDRRLRLPGRTVMQGKEICSTDCLAKCPLFAALGEAVLTTLRNECKVVVFHKGDIVVEAGEQGSSLFCLNKGIVEITTLQDGQEETQQKGEVGALWGFAGFCGRPEPASVIAASFCDFRSISFESFNEILMSFPELRKFDRFRWLGELHPSLAEQQTDSLGTKSGGIDKLEVAPPRSERGSLPLLRQKSTKFQKEEDAGQASQEPRRMQSQTTKLLDKLLLPRRSGAQPSTTPPDSPDGRKRSPRGLQGEEDVDVGEKGRRLLSPFRLKGSLSPSSSPRREDDSSSRPLSRGRDDSNSCRTESSLSRPISKGGQGTLACELSGPEKPLPPTSSTSFMDEWQKKAANVSLPIVRVSLVTTQAAMEALASLPGAGGSPAPDSRTARDDESKIVSWSSSPAGEEGRSSDLNGGETGISLQELEKKKSLALPKRRRGRLDPVKFSSAPPGGAPETADPLQPTPPSEGGMPPGTTRRARALLSRADPRPELPPGLR